MRSPKEVLLQARDWLDGHGKLAWIGAMVLGFVLFWPIGLALLFYMMGTNRMWSCSKERRAWRHERRGARMQNTGNVAFDTYREETLKRLEEEQAAFEAFLDQLRKAKDQAEFDQFMAARRAGTAPAPRRDESREDTAREDWGREDWSREDRGYPGAAPQPA